MTLKISSKLVLPLSFVTSKQAILAKSRVGKSYTAQVQAEELLKAEQQVLVLDPTSAWWGLRTHADGDKPGYPIAVFGGDHGDLELLPSSGAAMARAAVSDGFNAIFDLSLFDPEEAVVWGRAFGDALFKDNRHAMHLFVDEADMFAPQNPSTKDEHRCLKTYDRIIRRGGIKGIGCTLICQRSALLNKNVLSQVDMLTVLRMHHPLDLEPVEKWVKVKGDPERGKKMMASLPSLSLGQAWVWNPDVDLFDLITVRHKRTFDSGKTPEPGQRAVAPKVLAKVDIDRLGAAIAATVERAKENDPAALKAKIADLEKKLAAAARAPATPAAPVVEYQVDEEALDRAFIAGSAAAMLEAQGQLNVRMGMMRKAAADLLDTPTLVMPPDITRAQISRLAKKNRHPAAARKPIPQWTCSGCGMTNGSYSGKENGTPEFHAQKSSGLCVGCGRHYQTKDVAHGNILDTYEGFVRQTIDRDLLPGGEQKILDALAWWAALGIHTPENIQVAYMAGYSPSSNGYKNPRGVLNGKKLIEYTGDGCLRLTHEGTLQARHPVLQPTTKDLHEAVMERLDGSQQRILCPLLVVWPGEMSNEDLAAEANYSPSSNGYKNPRGSLRSLGLVTYPTRGTVRAADLLFPERHRP